MKKTINSLLFLVYLVAGSSASGTSPGLVASASTEFSLGESCRRIAGSVEPST